VLDFVSYDCNEIIYLVYVNCERWLKRVLKINITFILLVAVSFSISVP
jgi:hypothetical protein